MENTSQSPNISSSFDFILFDPLWSTLDAISWIDKPAGNATRSLGRNLKKI